MKCPKCNEEIPENIKFCTKCGANIAEETKKIEEEKAKKEAELEKKKKAEEDKKNLERIRKEEKLKKEKEQKEAEKREAIRQAKEEGIELEIIENEPEEIYNEKTPDFKIKKEEAPKQQTKKRKVKLKKNIFQRLFNKLIFMIIVAALIIGGIYYCYTQEMLPEFAQKEVKDFDKTVRNVIELYKDTQKNNHKIDAQEESENWKVEADIDADDIRDLTDEVSVIVKDGKEGLIDNKTGEILLSTRFNSITYTTYYDIEKTKEDKEEGIVVEALDRYYTLNNNYEPDLEVIPLTKTEENGTYYFEIGGQNIYYNTDAQECTLVKPDSKTNELKPCISIDLVTTEGIVAKRKELPEKFTIDFAKSSITTKGYFNTKTAKLEINCDYTEAYEFSEGLAAVKKENKSGFIDEKQNEILEFKYEETRSVHKGLAFVKKDGKWGIMKIK